MKTALQDCMIYRNGVIQKGSMTADIAFDGGDVLSLSNLYVFPAFCDVNVHFREPGFSYKETIFTGSRAAARGGYSDVCTMPNLSPVPDSVEHIKKQLDITARDSAIAVHPFAAITIGEEGKQLAPLEALAPYCIGFSDDGKGVQDAGMMREAMQRAKGLHKIISAHCEDNTLLHGGYIHDGSYAAAHAHKGICSASEWKPIERDIDLAAQTGCAYHVCHISCLESVELIRQAKKSGVNISCETAPHYLCLDESDLQEDGRFKMNPPLRTPKDKEALLEGLADGTIDMIATDHAPHAAEEKAKGLRGSAMGISGIEIAFPVLYTNLVRRGILPLEKLVALLTDKPRERFGIANQDAFCAFDLEQCYDIRAAEFISKGKSTPFDGMRVYGKNILTVYGGKTVWKES